MSNNNISINVDYLAEDLAKQDFANHLNFIGDDYAKVSGYFDDENNYTELAHKAIEHYKKQRIEYLRQFELLYTTQESNFKEK